MKKIIIEVGSTNTKIDNYENDKVTRIKEETILFKKHYKEKNKLEDSDVRELIDIVNDIKKEYDDIYVCGTSIFRNLNEKEKKDFLDYFKLQTGIDFNIITEEDENKLTVCGATRKVNIPVCVFIGGGGSTEITIYTKKEKESINTEFGVMDVMEKFPDLADDIAKSKLEDVKDYIKKHLNLPKEKCDTLILAGGGHLLFALNSSIKYEKNTIYTDNNAPIMMDIETREKETKRYYESISLDAIRKRVDNPDWWFATRAMCAFVLVVAEEIDAKVIIPTDINMVYGIIAKEEKNDRK